MPFEYRKNKKRDEWAPAWLDLMDERLREGGFDPEEARREMQAGAVIEIKGRYRGARLCAYRWRAECG